MFDFKKFLNKKNIAIILCALAVLIAGLTIIICIKNSRVSAVVLEGTNINLVAKDKNARKGIIKDTGSARFDFSQTQKNAFVQAYEKNKTAALVIRMEFKPNDSQRELLTTGAALPFNFGILYQDDFDNKGKLKEPLTSKITVYADLSKKLSYADNAPFFIDFSMAIPKSEHIENFLPTGFFINSSISCRVVSACVAPALLGFDVSTEIPFYGFASNGGLVNFQNTSVDFAGASLVFPIQNTRDADMPQFVIGLSQQEEQKNITARISIGGEKFYIRNAKDVTALEIPTAALKSPFGITEFSENRECITSFLLKSNNLEKYKAIRTDPGLILNYNQKNWRQAEYEVFEWDRYPGILFFDIADYEIQNNFFRRLAYYVEKSGYKGKLWPDSVLADKHGYNAHDYSAESLASFFNKAAEENFPLLEEELTLKQILIANGLLIPQGQTVIAGEGGLVSISRESDAYTRSKLMAHEAWHTLFFRDEAFRNFVAAVYYTFDPDSRQFLLDFFASQSGLGYDIEDEYLMHNEFMAYIMQQSVAGVPEYFVGRANLYSVRVFTPELAKYVRDTNAKGFEDAAVILNDYTYDTYGIKGGNVALINR